MFLHFSILGVWGLELVCKSPDMVKRRPIYAYVWSLCGKPPTKSRIMLERRQEALVFPDHVRASFESVLS